jgi:hypothetical protein
MAAHISYHISQKLCCQFSKFQIANHKTITNNLRIATNKIISEMIPQGWFFTLTNSQLNYIKLQGKAANPKEGGKLPKKPAKASQ